MGASTSTRSRLAKRWVTVNPFACAQSTTACSSCGEGEKRAFHSSAVRKCLYSGDPFVFRSTRNCSSSAMCGCCRPKTSRSIWLELNDPAVTAVPFVTAGGTSPGSSIPAPVCAWPATAAARPMSAAVRIRGAVVLFVDDVDCFTFRRFIFPVVLIERRSKADLDESHQCSGRYAGWRIGAAFTIVRACRVSDFFMSPEVSQNKEDTIKGRN